MTAGGVPPLKRLHARYRDRVRFLDVIVRQAHPGERRGSYASFAEKAADAAAYRREEAIPWPVLVDDLDGTVHRAYGGLADPVYLLDAEGRVAFYGTWTNGPRLQRAIAGLLARGGVGASGAGAGIDRRPHASHALAAGWSALSRGGRRAVLDLELAAPSTGGLIFLGHLARPLLAPLALRATPLPTHTRLLLCGGLLASLAVGFAAARPRR